MVKFVKKLLSGLYLILYKQRVRFGRIIQLIHMLHKGYSL